MIEASLDFWIYLIVMIVWAISSILEAKRKAELKKKQQEQSSAEPIASDEESREALKRAERQALEDAELEAQRAPYEHVPTGEDQEVRSEHLMTESEHTQESSSDEETSSATNSYLEAQRQLLKNQARAAALRSIASSKKEVRPSSRLIPLNPIQAVVMNEILQKPRSLRRGSR